MVAGANSYRQMHEFIRIHRQLLNEAFGLELRYSPSYAGLWLICQIASNRDPFSRPIMTPTL